MSPSPGCRACRTRSKRIIRRDPDVIGVVSIVGVGTTNSAPNAGHFAVTLKPKSERAASASEIAARLADATGATTGINSAFPGRARHPDRHAQEPDVLSICAIEHRPCAFLRRGRRRVFAALKARPELTDVSSDLQESGPALVIKVDRVAAGRLGVSMQDVNNALYNAFGQRQISTIYGQANQYRVVLEAGPGYQTDPAVAGKAVRAGRGMISGVSRCSRAARTRCRSPSFATVECTTRPLAVHRVQQFPAATIGFNLAPDVSLDQARGRHREATVASIGCRPRSAAVSRARCRNSTSRWPTSPG